MKSVRRMIFRVAARNFERLPKLLCCLVLTGFFTALSFGQTAQAERDSLEKLLREHAHPFRIKEGRLSGQGEKFLINSLTDVQFVAYGEEHNRRAIHQFGGAFFRLLHENFGFNYLALEEDPFWGEMLSKAARKGNGEEVFELAGRYPNAFHLLSEEEIKMIAGVGRISKAKKNPVWGLNQVFGAAHFYARLVEIAPDEPARRTARTLLDEALEYEKERFGKNVHYLVKIAKAEDFSKLRKAFRPAPGSEAAFLIDQIELSHQIFSPYAATPRPPSSVFYEAGKMRETNMKHLFAERYRQARAEGETLPKVMAMFGQLHLYRGLSERTEQFTLGNFLSETAIFNGHKSFHIYGTVDTDYTRKSFFAELVRIASEAAGDSASGTIIDLRPVFDGVRRDKDLDPQLRRLIMSFDAFLFLRDGEEGSVKRFETPNFRWYPD